MSKRSGTFSEWIAEHGASFDNRYQNDLKVRRSKKKRDQRPNASGLTPLENRFTEPSSSMMNFSKFHRMSPV